MRELYSHHPQVELDYQHTLHGGVYTRTLRMPAGAIVATVEIVVPTTLILNGRIRMLLEDGTWFEFRGYHVLQADAPRSGVWSVWEDTIATLIHKTDAKTVDEAEAEITNEPDSLHSRWQESQTTNRKESLCQESHGPSALALP